MVAHPWQLIDIDFQVTEFRVAALSLLVVGTLAGIRFVRSSGGAPSAPMLRHVRSVLSSARLLNASESACVPGQALSTSAFSQAAPPDSGWLPPEAYFYERQLPSHDKYCRQRNRLPIGPRYPAIAQNAYIAPSAVVIGDVDILDSVRLPMA